MSRTEELKITFPRRIAVVNRGEAAVRLIRAVRELNAEYDCGIKTVALHTDAERRAMFVRQADEAVTLRKTSAGIAYLDHAELERACTFLVVLARGQVRVSGPVRELLATHGAGLEEIALRHLRAGVPSSSRTEAGQ